AGLDRAVRVEIQAAVGKAVGGDVEDPHHQGPRAQLERFPEGERNRVGAARGHLGIWKCGNVEMWESGNLGTDFQITRFPDFQISRFFNHSCVIGLCSGGMPGTIDGRSFAVFRAASSAAGTAAAGAFTGSSASPATMRRTWSASSTSR